MMEDQNKQEESQEKLISRGSEYKAVVLGYSEGLKKDEKLEKSLNYLEDKWPRLDLNGAIQRSGDEGRYQKLIYFNAVIILFSASFTVYTISYVVPDPVPFC